MSSDGYTTIRIPLWAKAALDELVKEMNEHGLNRLPWNVRAQAAEYERPTAQGHVAGYAFLMASGAAAHIRDAPSPPPVPTKQPKRAKR